jgi:hypothetical protein
MSTTYKRNGNRWSINEILTLQREYELLEWSVYKIAEKHQRTVMAILCKLKAEQFISHFKEARGFDVEEYKKSFDESYNIQNNEQKGNDDEDEDEDDEIECCAEDDEYVPQDDDEDDEEYYDDEYENEDVEQLTDRVWSIQTSVNEISSIVKNIFGLLSSKPNYIESEL